jgi:glycerophosphoryl diester phosphodiesterase
MSCKKDITLDNLNGNKIGCFGHAGMGTRSLYPANTLQSFETCLSRGADGTEMDIQVTKDGVLVIYHDADLSSVTKCGGIIRDLNWAEISSCRFSKSLMNNFDVISFDEFFQTISNPYRYTYTFDCKLTEGSGNNDEYYKIFTSAIVSTIEKYGIQENVLIENSDPGFLNLIKTQNNQLKLFVLGDDFEKDLNTVTQNGFYGISYDNNAISVEQIQKAHDNDVRITIYGVQTNKQNYDAISKQPDFIQTDDLDYVLKLFGKFNRNSGRLSELIHNISLNPSK